MGSSTVFFTGDGEPGALQSPTNIVSEPDGSFVATWLDGTTSTFYAQKISALGIPIRSPEILSVAAGTIATNSNGSTILIDATTTLVMPSTPSNPVPTLRTTFYVQPLNATLSANRSAVAFFTGDGEPGAFAIHLLTVSTQIQRLSI